MKVIALRPVRHAGGRGQARRRAGVARRALRARRLHHACTCRSPPRRKGLIDARRAREDEAGRAHRSTARAAASSTRRRSPTRIRAATSPAPRSTCSPRSRRRRITRCSRCRQVIATPHLGAATSEAQINVAVAIAEQMTKFLLRGDGRRPRSTCRRSAPRCCELLRPYLRLGEKLGSFLAQLSTRAADRGRGRVRRQVAELDVRPVTIAVLRGLLGALPRRAVNYVNAPALARERGIAVKRGARQPADATSSTRSRCAVTRGAGTHDVEGAVFGTDILRLVRIDDFYMEAVPEGYVLMLNNRDVPGVVGRVGTLARRSTASTSPGSSSAARRPAAWRSRFVHVDERGARGGARRAPRARPTSSSAQLLQL